MKVFNYNKSLKTYPKNASDLISHCFWADHTSLQVGITSKLPHKTNMAGVAHVQVFAEKSSAQERVNIVKMDSILSEVSAVVLPTQPLQKKSIRKLSQIMKQTVSHDKNATLHIPDISLDVVHLERQTCTHPLH